MERIPVAGPWITQQEIDAVADAAARAWYGDANLFHVRLERQFRNTWTCPTLSPCPPAPRPSISCCWPWASAPATR